MLETNKLRYLFFVSTLAQIIVSAMPVEETARYCQMMQTAEKAKVIE